MHPERGEAILLRLAEELKEMAVVESRPNLDGRNMIMMLAPVKNPGNGAAAPAEAEAEAEAEAS
ncbi:Translation initiation factor IF-3 [compost metagenome]